MKAPLESVVIFGKGWIWRWRGVCCCRRLWCPCLPLLEETETKVGISLDDRAAKHNRNAACAKTIVDRRIPRMNRTWKVVVTLEPVVAIETSRGLMLALFFSLHGSVISYRLLSDQLEEQQLIRRVELLIPLLSSLLVCALLDFDCDVVSSASFAGRDFPLTGR